MTVYTLLLYISLAAIALTLLLGVIPNKMRGLPNRHAKIWYVQYFVGALLIFSGLVKAVDPLGTAYKMKDYFTEFDTQGLPGMEFMHQFAVEFSVFMLVVELVLGACLILGIGQRKTTGATLMMMLFFTFLTGFNYMTGFQSKVDGVGFFEFSKWTSFSSENIRITDCGCFGDFMKLLPIETFLKDILFTVLSIILLVRTSRLNSLISLHGKLGPIHTRRAVVSILVVASFYFCLKNYYLDIPMVDFRPFAVGVDLNKAKEDCANNPTQSVTYLTYRNSNTGEVVEVNSQDLVKPENKKFWSPNPETGKPDWEVDSDKTRSEVIDPGCTSQIQYFDNYEVLEQPGYQMLVLAVDLDKTDKESFKKIGQLAQTASESGVTTRCMYNYISHQELSSFKQEVGNNYDFTVADEKLIKTIIRSNPGLLLIKDGVVVNKWHGRHIPNMDELGIN